MKKDGGATSPVHGGATAKNPVGKLFLSFETKPFLATLLTITLVLLVWNFQPYYDHLLNTTNCRCSTTVKTTTNHLINTTTTTTAVPSTTPLLSLSTLPTSPRKKLPPKDPNKREFTPYGNAAALFVQMGAYRGGPNSFAIIGLASKPIHVFSQPWFKCEWVPFNSSARGARAKGVRFLPDWGYGRVYTVVVVNCTFPTHINQDNTGGKLFINAYYSQSQKLYERFTALEEQPRTYDNTVFNSPPKYDYLYCGSSLYGTLNPSRIREWIAYHVWFFGEKSHFVFHDAGGVSEEVKKVLDPWVKKGRVTIQDVRAQEIYDGYYHNQFLVLNDCLHRYRFDAKWMFFFDVDEYIYLPNGGSTKELGVVMNEFDGFTQFTIEQNTMSSSLCLNDSSQDYSRQWGFEKLLFRDWRTKIRKDRKYAIQARNALATGVHMSENIVGKSLHHTETRIQYYHYHDTIQVLDEPCRVFLPPSAKRKITFNNKLPYVYDDNMKKLADTIKRFERDTLGTSSQLTS